MESRPPDIVICDHGLPGMDGMTLLSRFGAGHPDAVKILISAHPSARLAEEVKAGRHRRGSPEAVFDRGDRADAFATVRVAFRWGGAARRHGRGSERGVGVMKTRATVGGGSEMKATAGIPGKWRNGVFAALLSVTFLALLHSTCPRVHAERRRRERRSPHGRIPVAGGGGHDPPGDAGGPRQQQPRREHPQKLRPGRGQGEPGQRVPPERPERHRPGEAVRRLRPAGQHLLPRGGECRRRPDRPSR